MITELLIGLILDDQVVRGLAVLLAALLGALLIWVSRVLKERFDIDVEQSRIVSITQAAEVAVLTQAQQFKADRQQLKDNPAAKRQLNDRMHRGAVEQILQEVPKAATKVGRFVLDRAVQAAVRRVRPNR